MLARIIILGSMFLPELFRPAVRQAVAEAVEVAVVIEAVAEEVTAVAAEEDSKKSSEIFRTLF
jgi:hypothetical protein